MVVDPVQSAIFTNMTNLRTYMSSLSTCLLSYKDELDSFQYQMNLMSTSTLNSDFSYEPPTTTLLLFQHGGEWLDHISESYTANYRSKKELADDFSELGAGKLTLPATRLCDDIQESLFEELTEVFDDQEKMMVTFCHCSVSKNQRSRPQVQEKMMVTFYHYSRSKARFQGHKVEVKEMIVTFYHCSRLQGQEKMMVSFYTDLLQRVTSLQRYMFANDTSLEQFARGLSIWRMPTVNFQTPQVAAVAVITRPHRVHSSILYCFRDMASYLSNVSDFTYPTRIWRPLRGWPRSNFTKMFDGGNLESMRYRVHGVVIVILHLAVLVELRLLSDTDEQTNMRR